MKRSLFITLAMLMGIPAAFAQSYGGLIRDGNNAFEKKNFKEAEKEYRKALQKDPKPSVGTYNLADALYKQKKYAEAGNLLRGLQNNEKDKSFLSDIYHNMGNTYLAEKKYEESIDAYKQSLRLKPEDRNTRYNLSYAMSKLLQQQQQQKQDKNKKDKNKENKNKDKQNSSQNNKSEQKDKQQKQQEGKMSKEQAEQLLSAIAKQEKDINEKMKRKKAKGGNYKPEKDW